MSSRLVRSAETRPVRTAVARALSGLLAFVVVATASAAARAEPVRILVAASRSEGLPGERPLHHAQEDAAKVAAVFLSLGGVARDNALLVPQATPQQLREALNRAVSLAAMHRPDEVTLIFYFSGHGDRENLHLGGETLPLSELSMRIGAVPALLRVVVLDACRTTDPTRPKGMSAAPAFAISLHRNAEAVGTVWLYASADGEAAQESDDLGGAVFTHAWVTGLRGAADTNGDHQVTLGESYSYAYHQTLFRSAKSSGVLQRPAARYDVRESEPIVLTRTGPSTARLAFPEGADTQYLVYGIRSRTVVAEVWSDPSRPVVLALPAGRYLVQRRNGAQGGAAELTLAEREQRDLQPNDFRDVALEALASKGGAIVLRPNEIELGASLLPATSTLDLAYQASARYGRTWGEWAVVGGFDGGFGSALNDANEVNERWAGAELRAEYRWALTDSLTARAGLGPSAQIVWQTLRRRDAARVEPAGYVAERRYSGWAFGGEALAGFRFDLPDPLHFSWVGFDGTAAARGARAAGGPVLRWSLGASAALGLRF